MTPPQGPATMRSRILRGVAWKAFSLGFRQVWRLAVVVILARLLTPHDYGLAAMVLVFSSLVIIFSDLALGAALIQREHLSERDRSTVFWTGTAVGLAFTLVGLALSGPVAAFYGEPDVQPLFAALSLSFVVTSLGTTHTALMHRDMNFKSLELRLMGGAVVGGVVGVVLALRGYGAWAIIGQQVAIALTSTVLLWVVSPWHPRFVFSLASLRSLGAFSLNVFGTRVVFYVNRNVDNLLIGRYLGSTALGLYAVAYNVMLAPLAQIAAPIVEVLTPAFARMQHDKRAIGVLWLRASRLVGSIVIPGMLGLALVAPEFVSVVLGDRWAGAVPVIQILAWVGLLQGMQRFNSAILQACDRTRTLLRCSLVTVAASIVAFVIGMQWGIVGVAAAYAVASTFVEPYYGWCTMRATHVPVAEYLRNLRGVAAATAGMCAAVLVARGLLPADLPALPRLVTLIGVGVLAYLPLCAWRAPELLDEISAVAGRRRARVRPAPVQPGAPV
jgi:O-antigen/teichoic acid export membrane protein